MVHCLGKWVRGKQVTTLRNTTAKYQIYKYTNVLFDVRIRRQDVVPASVTSREIDDSQWYKSLS